MNHRYVLFLTLAATCISFPISFPCATKAQIVTALEMAPIAGDQDEPSHPGGTLPGIRRKTTVPGHEGEYCYTYTIPELRDPRTESTYCEWTNTTCANLDTEEITYITSFERNCREWPNEPLPVPSHSQCVGGAGGPGAEKDFFSCEENANTASFNCTQASDCNYGVSLIECHNLPPGHGIRENCYTRASEQLRNDLYACQVAYSNAIAECELRWPTDHSRQGSCLRRAARLREIADGNCSFIIDPHDRDSCLAESEREHERRAQACLAIS